MSRKSIKQYDAWCSQLAERINRDVQPFSDMSIAAKLERKNRAKNDYLYALTTYFPHHFVDAFSREHAVLMKSYSRQNEIQFWNCYRGFGKSTHAKALLVMDLVFKKTRFAGYASYNEDKAAMHLATPKVELEANPRLRHDFGITIEGDATFWRTNLGSAVKAYGRRQSFKGDTFMQFRPDLFFFDDFDSDEYAENPKVAQRGLNWVIEQAIPGCAPKWRAFYLGTPPTGRHSVYKLIKRNPGVTVIDVPAERKIGVMRRRAATWPQRHPLKWLDSQKKLIGRTAYDRNYLLKEVHEKSPFMPDDFKFYGKNSQAVDLTGMFKVGYLDPSIKDTAQHDGKAFITLVQNRSGGPVYCHDAWGAHCSTDRMIRAMYEAYLVFRHDLIGVEENAMPLLKNEIDRYQAAYGVKLPIRLFRAVTNKKSRIITTLEGPVQRGDLLFAEDQEEVLDQLIDIENNGVADDLADALQGAYVMLLRPNFGRIDDVMII